eukprot:CAMPEP_0184496758 /NCGR_PEP_ID=MMETSP0113_2-20130426/34797_1 /TAXON_ID=91329 /ORGANISM="Norrisiella sphaerica, Strain BC52" /LENGTH=118 /DNA_ID=CAMNT_0026883541 /DNA_START=354 /DNA_END=710 /DNA_ORIENTATION=+
MIPHTNPNAAKAFVQYGRFIFSMDVPGLALRPAITLKGPAALLTSLLPWANDTTHPLIITSGEKTALIVAGFVRSFSGDASHPTEISEKSPAAGKGVIVADSTDTPPPSSLSEVAFDS